MQQRRVCCAGSMPREFEIWGTCRMYFGEEGTDVYVGSRRVNRSVS